MATKLTPAEQEAVARRLTMEYRWLGVLLPAARECVRSGQWDDHPLAQALIARRTEQRRRRRATADPDR